VFPLRRVGRNHPPSALSDAVVHDESRPRHDGLLLFFAVACGWTWLLAAPAAWAWMHHAAPPPVAVACAGLSAFGPLVAALLVAATQRRLGDVFRRWRANPLWLVAALLAPMAIHLVATALSVALGDTPARWLHPPSAPEQVAALVVFPLGEEPGWRGFAYPRIVERLGVVRGALALGAVWGLWHVAYAVTPDAAGFDVVTFALTMAELPLYSLLMAWVLERTNRSLSVAIAFHAGAHLDHLELAPHDDVRLHGAHLAVVAVLAALAARSLRAEVPAAGAQHA
jgi:membrane protease YdiL (CAAX protease family)